MSAFQLFFVGAGAVFLGVVIWVCWEDYRKR